MSQYPEHDKLTAIKDESQAIGEFLDLGPYQLAKWVDGDLWPVHDIEGVLADHFGIDRDKLENEKRQMLEALRAS